MSTGAYASAVGRSDPVASADETTAALLSLNGLSFVATDTSLSVVQSRTHKKYDAVIPTVVAGNELTLRLNTGSQFLNARNSFISFDLSVSTAAQFAPSTSVLSLFDEYRFQHSSGVEIERIQDANSWYNLREYWTQDQTHADTVGKLYLSQNTGNGTPPYAGDALGVADAGKQRVIIPLYLISEMFDQNVLLPPYLIAGSTISFKMAANTKAMVSALASVYTITNASINLDLYTVTDGVLRSITAISSTSGLDIDFTSVWTEQQSLGVKTSASFAVNKAISMAQGVHAWIRPTTNETIALNSFKSTPLTSLSHAQVNLGSMFLPLQGIKNKEEAYAYMLQYWGLFANRRESPRQLLSGLVAPAGVLATPDKDNFGTVTQMLERSQILASGTAISAQRNLQMDISYSAPPVSDSKVTIFLQYAKLVSVFLDSAVVRS